MLVLRPHLALTQRGCAQARDGGFASAAAAQRLEANALLLRVAAVAEDVEAVRVALVPSPAASDGAGLHRGAVALTFSSLPLAVFQRILGFLPVDARARAALVARAWRDACAEPAIWRELHLSTDVSVVTVAVTDAVLRGAAARAQGQAATLDICGCVNISAEALLEVVTANVSSLQKLWCFGENYSVLPAVRELEPILLAAPQVHEFYVDVDASITDAVRMLCNDAPFQALRISALRIMQPTDDISEAEVLLFVAALPKQSCWLQSLVLDRLPLRTTAVLDAVITSALACTVERLKFLGCCLSPASVPALSRLLPNVQRLCVVNDHDALLDLPAAVQLAGVIAAHHTLTQLQLSSAQLCETRWLLQSSYKLLLGTRA